MHGTNSVELHGLIGLQIGITAHILGFTSRDAILRYVGIVPMLYCAYLQVPYIALVQNPILRGFLANSPFVLIILYIDKVLLHKWTFAARGPTSSFGGLTPVYGDLMRRSQETQDMCKCIACDNDQQLRFGLGISLQSRFAATEWPTKNIPPFARNDPDYLPGKAEFLRANTLKWILYILILDIAGIFNHGNGNTTTFASERIPLLTRASSVSGEELVTRIAVASSFWIFQYLVIEVVYGAFAILAIASGVSTVAAWPPMFGFIGDCWSLRQFWGCFYHQLLRRGCGSIAHAIAYSLLKLERGGFAGRYLFVLLTFAISGVFHTLSDFSQGIPWQESGAMQFFCIQALGIMIEDFVQAIFSPREKTNGAGEGPRSIDPYAPPLSRESWRPKDSRVFSEGFPHSVSSGWRCDDTIWTTGIGNPSGNKVGLCIYEQGRFHWDANGLEGAFFLEKYLTVNEDKLRSAINSMAMRGASCNWVQRTTNSCWLDIGALSSSNAFIAATMTDDMSSLKLLYTDNSLAAIVFTIFAVAGPFFTTWVFSSWRAHRALSVAGRTASGSKRAPTMPYSIPMVGHLLQFMWNGHSLMSKASSFAARNVPTRIILPIFSNYVVSGPESVVSYFKESRDLSTTSRSLTIMVNAFGCPNHLVDLFKPQPPSTASNTHQHEGIEHLIHRAVKSGLSGAHLDALTARFQENLVQQIAAGPFPETWTELPDLNAFVEKQVFEAAMRSMFGTYMLSLNPTLAEDFWGFNQVIGTLFMSLPRWLSPAAYKKRDKMLRSIKKWQKYVGEHCDIVKLEDVDWEPYYGSKFIRERQMLLTKRGIMDETARAAENFAFMWATNSNSVPAATWFLLEILQDPSLRSRVSEILPPAALTPSKLSSQSTFSPIFDTPKLCSSPLLQSLYAETLRLRVAVLVVREPARDNYSFRGWHIKKEEVLSISTRTEAMNPEVWNAGSARDAHPLDTMWADRFIVDPRDPNSGPLSLPNEKRKQRLQDGSKRSGEPYFSMDGLAASWIPYGGGTSLCPGRHFAKQEIITTAAILLTAFDIELIGEKERGKVGVDMGCFGFGTMPPDRKVPFRIRRKRA
ncbi:MAG: hypothetical protein Q9170_007209 [Blastenia crenularia]